MALFRSESTFALHRRWGEQESVPAFDHVRRAGQPKSELTSHYLPSIDCLILQGGPKLMFSLWPLKLTLSASLPLSPPHATPLRRP